MRNYSVALAAALLLSACAEAATPAPALPPTDAPTATAESTVDPLSPTPLPTRTRWEYGEPLPYVVQSGDSLAAVAAHFNTTPEAILAANPNLPAESTTLPPGLELVIPASFAPLLGSAYKIIPDSELVYGPGQVDLDLQAVIEAHGGWLATRLETSAGALRPSWEILHRVGLQYSVNPRLLLALLEYRSGVLTGEPVDATAEQYPLGMVDSARPGLTGQLRWAAERLNAGYYGWRSGSQVEVTLADGRASRLDPWQNAGTAALYNILAAWHDAGAFEAATAPNGLAAVYRALFGDPFAYEVQLMPGDFQQPVLQLPFQPDKVWAFSGGPHPVWGDSLPWAALDFAPPAVVTGCGYSTEWATAVAEGVVARSGEATVVLDLDGDGDERTGWAILYFHLRSDELAATGALLQAGGLIGHPSCEGGRATGSHVHVARKYNGEWLAAGGMIPFNLSGWVAEAGSVPYEGWLTYEMPAQRLTACPCVSGENYIALGGSQ